MCHTHGQTTRKSLFYPHIYHQITGSPPQTRRPYCNNHRLLPSDEIRTSQVFRMGFSLTVVFTEWTPIGFKEFSSSIFPSRRPRRHTSIIHTKHESTQETAWGGWTRFERAQHLKRASRFKKIFLQRLCDCSTSGPLLLLCVQRERQMNVFSLQHPHFCNLEDMFKVNHHYCVVVEKSAQRKVIFLWTFIGVRFGFILVLGEN